MYLLFRSLMVILFFLVWLALWQAGALAILAIKPLMGGMALADLPSLMPKEGGTPQPIVIAAGASVVVNIFLAMSAMLISEHATGVGRFIALCFKAAFILMLLFGIPFSIFVFSQPMDEAEKLPLIGLLAGAILLPTVVVSFLLSLPFLAWVSEKPRRAKAVPGPYVPPEDVEPAPMLEPAVETGPVMVAGDETMHAPEDQPSTALPAGPITPPSGSVH
ncbi:hypothetical protein HDIA_3608 [Hartmannibacter diazotrophicus]|uniref:Uncharacterized protein n=1 Tax=Hartmannibacter diazotrophicus TaxID=1482074 RepID=A0A2C9DAE9_9HYPH|nr:hypothetical protein [Hartmannibacter diazotrophicus]SON57149.1 hypothetical protein HDIA_3608 [Hartmannibacter diazotrophicus]